MKNFGLSCLLLLSICSFGLGTQASFIDFQRNFTRPGQAMQRKLDTLVKQFAAKNLEWPARYLYIRSFKFDSQLEVWVSNSRKEPYKLFKTYRVCALAGSLGPKRMAGDFQVPEGFYYINEFNPNSNYYLSLGLNYPNVSDRILSDPVRPGGDIYIHGSCVTVGCIPVTDQQIDEIYLLAAYAKNAGQDYIPVHIFPVRYNNKKGVEYLETITKSDEKLKDFENRLEAVYDHFEATHRLPVVMIDSRGEYQFDGLTRKAIAEAPVKKQKREPVQHRVRTVTQLADVVYSWPKFQGGGDNFLKFLEKMGKAIGTKLPQGMQKANVQIEFIVDVDGVPTNFKVLQGVNEEFDDEMISILEQMPVWEPATVDDKPVAKKIKQSFLVEK